MDKPTNSSIDTIARTCIAVRLRLLNRVVTNFYDDALRPLGLKVSQLNILIVTAKLGLARPAQVCEILQLDASTLSRNVKPLQAHGWLEVVPGRGRPCPALPADGPGQAADREGGPGLGGGPAPGHRTAGGRGDRPARQGGQEAAAGRGRSADRPVFFSA